MKTKYDKHLTEIDWNKAERIKRLTDTETPFKVIDCPDGHTIRLYYTKGGSYGWQVTAILYTPGHTETYSYKTGGYGYSKEGLALEMIFLSIGKAPRGYISQNEMPCGHYPAKGKTVSYAVGGNYYKINQKDFLNYK